MMRREEIYLERLDRLATMLEERWPSNVEFWLKFWHAELGDARTCRCAIGQAAASGEFPGLRLAIGGIRYGHNFGWDAVIAYFGLEGFAHHELFCSLDDDSYDHDRLACAHRVRRYVAECRVAA